VIDALDASHPGTSGLMAPPDVVRWGSQAEDFEWLPIVDAFRTLCIAPIPEARHVFEAIRALCLGGCRTWAIIASKVGGWGHFPDRLRRIVVAIWRKGSGKWGALSPAQ